MQDGGGDRHTDGTLASRHDDAAKRSTGFELLTKKNERYSLTPVASRFLVGESPDYIGAMMEHGDMLWNSWAQLKDVVRTGKPAVKVESMETAEIFSPILVRG